MRKILFRGKRADNGEWVQGDLLQNVDCLKIREQEKDIKHIAKSFAVFPETVGQYTGFTDKNGNKVFEGDILKNGCGGIRVVVFMNTRFILKNKANNMCSSWAYMDNHEIIGNIHDNPELLNER